MTHDDPIGDRIDSLIEDDFLHEWLTHGTCDLQALFGRHNLTDLDDMVRMIQLDQRERSVRGIKKLAEEYLRDHPEVARDGDRTFEVIFEEYALGEDDPQLVQDLSTRFPLFASLLEKQVAVYHLLISSRRQSDIRSPTLIAEDKTLGEVPPELENRFEFQEMVGRGGVGVVFRARDRALGRIVAIKVLNGSRSHHKAQAVRFLSEAEIIARLQHPHIVQLFEVVRTEGVLAIVLEYIDGGTLADRLQRGRFTPMESARLLRSLAFAVEFAHGKGIIHRDLKPGNVLIENTSKRLGTGGDSEILGFIPKLADFGLAKSIAPSMSDLSPQNATVTGEILGTPRYLSPEQIKGLSDDSLPAIDIHALGVILFEVLTGRTPFEGPSVIDYLRQVTDQDAQFSVLDQKTVPRDLQVICLRCLEKDPRKRYESARGLAEDLDRFIHSKPILARPITYWMSVTRWCERYPGMAALVAAVIILLSLLAGGSVIAAVRLKHQSEIAESAEGKAVALERERRLELFRSLLENARTHSASGNAGQRLEAIQLLQEAMKVKSIDSLSKVERTDLVTTALASIANADIREISSIPLRKEGDPWVDIDPEFERIIQIDPTTGVMIVRSINESEPSWNLSTPDDSYVAPRIVKFSPTGRWIADTGYTGKDHPLRIWDTQTKQVRWLIPRGPVGLSFAFHPDDRQICYISESTIHLFDLIEGKVIRTSPPQFSDSNRMHYRPDGRILALACEQSGIQFINTETWEFTSAHCPTPISGSFVWKPNSQELVAATLDGRLYTWSESTQRGWFLPTKQSSVVRLEFSKNGSYLAASNDRDAEILRADGNQPLLKIDGRIIRFASESSRIAITKGDRLSIAEIVHSTGRRQILRSAESATLSPDGTMMAISGDSGVQIYTTEPFTLVHDLQLDSSGPVAFGPKKTFMITFGTFSGVQLWPINKGETWTIGPPRKLTLPDPPAGRVMGLQPQYSGKHAAVSPDGTRVAIVDNRNNRLVLFDLRNGSHRTIGDLVGITHVKFSPDDIHVAAVSMAAPHIVVWNLDTSKIELELAEHGGMDFSSDGRFFVTRTIPSIYVFDCRTWKQVREIPLRHPAGTKSRIVTFQPHSSLVAVAGQDSEICLVDVENGSLLTRIPDQGRDNEISSITFSADARLLAVNRFQSDISVWDLAILQKELAYLGINESLTPLPIDLDITRALPTVLDRGSLPTADNWHQYWRLLASYEAIQRRWTDALKSIDRAIASCPQTPAKSMVELLTLRGEYLWRCGRSSEARIAWQNAVALSTDARLAARHLAQVCTLGPAELRDPGRVMTLVPIIEVDSPGDAKLLLGMAKVRLGRHAEARELLATAKEHPKLQALADYHLALSFAMEGQSDLARDALSQALVAGSVHHSVDEWMSIYDLNTLRREIETILDQLP